MGLSTELANCFWFQVSGLGLGLGLRSPRTLFHRRFVNFPRRRPHRHGILWVEACLSQRTDSIRVYVERRRSSSPCFFSSFRVAIIHRPGWRRRRLQAHVALGGRDPVPRVRARPALAAVTHGAAARLGWGRCLSMLLLLLLLLSLLLDFLQLVPLVLLLLPRLLLLLVSLLLFESCCCSSSCS